MQGAVDALRRTGGSLALVALFALACLLAGASAPGATGASRGLVAAYGFDEQTGASVSDASGNRNTGTISGATRAPAGRYGGALRFDGRDDVVTVTDSRSLDLTSGMTLEAWVRPSGLGGSWRTAVIKEQSGKALSYALYAHTGGRGPSGHAYVAGNDRRARSDATIPSGTWTHLAATYDGSTIRLYRNGAEILAESAAGGIATSGGPLRIGGTQHWSEWFEGLIDEVRVYNRPLAAAEIRADMTTRIVAAPATKTTKAAPKGPARIDRSAPTAPSRLVRTRATRTTISLAWRASRDNVRVTQYGVYRNGRKLAAVSRRSATVRGLACGKRYLLAVDAADRAGNRSRRTSLRAATARCVASPPSTPTPPPPPTAPPTGGAAAHFVSSGGSDSGGCTSAAPCRSFDRAYRVASPGEVVEVAAGSYGSQTIGMDPSKNSAADVVFRPAAGAAVTLDELTVRGSHVEVRDMRLRSDGSVGSSPIATRDVTLRNLTGRSLFLRADDTRVIGGSYGGFNACDSGAPEDGVKIWNDSSRGADGIVLDGVRIHDVRRTGCDIHSDCIQIFSGTNHVIRNSTLVNCPTSGIIARPSGSSQKLENITIENNFFGAVLDGSEAINIGTAPDRCSGMVIRYNTVVNESSSFDCLTSGGAPGSLVEGNIISVGSGNDAVFRNNVFRPGSARVGTGAVQCNPVYRNPGAGDWRLAPADRCARGRGNPSSHPTTDAEGQPRPQGAVDAGADEIE